MRVKQCQFRRKNWPPKAHQIGKAWESQTRANMQLAHMAPQLILVDDPVTKVQMSAATIAAYHVTGRDQPWNGGCRRELSQNTERTKDETSCGMAHQLFDERVP